MRIRNKLISNNVLLVALVLLAGGVGIVDLGEQTKAMEYITGPAWGSADASMEGSIAVGEGIAAVDRLVGGIDVDGNRKRLTASRTKAKEALAELRTHGVLPADRVAELERAAGAGDEAADALLAAHETVVRSRTALDGNDASLDGLAEQFEVVGDAAMAARVGDRTKAFTWQELEPLYAAIDGAMEARVAALEQRFWLSRVENGSEPDKARTRVEAELGKQQQAFARVQKTEGFGERAAEAGKLAADYAALLTGRVGLLREHLGALAALRTAQQAFEQREKATVELFHGIESLCDGKVDDAKQGAVAMGSRAVSTLVATIAVSILFAAVVAFLIVKNLGRRLGTLEARLRDIAAGEGDLTVRLDATAKDELGAIAGWFNQFLAKLQATVRSIAATAGNVASGATEMTATAATLAKGAEVTKSHSTQVAAAAEQMATNMATVGGSTESMTGSIRTVAAAVEQMTASITQVAKNAEESAQVATTAASLAQASNQKVEALGQAANEIGRVIESIQDIAEQTNLLALNATIEAACAGEAGKGFSVVANEVKDLARQTAEATQDIRARIERIQKSTAESVAAIGEIDQVIAKVSAGSQLIATSVGEQRTATQEIAQNLSQTSMAMETVGKNVGQGVQASQDISRAVVEVDAQAKATAEGAGQASLAGESLAVLAEELRAQVGQFKI